MGNIVLLDDLTINKIAAGEVIERPASVVKEMVENSIDAGAKNIVVEIKNGGISLIKVTDDGSGIASDDMEIAFERHATSKIRKAEDLATVTSMGFRGEALASIAAISKVTMTSRKADDDIGHEITVEGGKVLEFLETVRSVGTTITVQNLFYNTPVRYKFLKKDYTEAGYIEDTVSRIAMVNKDVSIKLVSNGKTVIHTTGNGDLTSVVYSIYGRDTATELINVDYDYEGIKVEGVIGKPVVARANRSNQIFFVNNRYIKDKNLSAAADQAYKGMIPVGRYGFIILNVSMDPKLVDVNVHPAKLEVRFEDENKVFKAVYHAIKSNLAKSELVVNVQKSENQTQDITKSVFAEFTTSSVDTAPVDNTNNEEKIEDKIEDKNTVQIDYPGEKKGGISGLFQKILKEPEETQEELSNNHLEEIFKYRQGLKNNSYIDNSSSVISDNVENSFNTKPGIPVSTPLGNTESSVLNSSIPQDTQAVEPVITQATIEGNTQVVEPTVKTSFESQDTVKLDSVNINSLPQDTLELGGEVINKVEENNDEFAAVAGKMVEAKLGFDSTQTIDTSKVREALFKENEEYVENPEFDKMYKKTFGVDPFSVRREKQIESVEQQKLDASQEFSYVNENVFENNEETPEVKYKFIGIVFDTYIVIEIKDEMYILDQHAAHERIMYEKIKENYYGETEKNEQFLLLPDVISLTHKEMSVAKENVDMFARAGFSFEEFGDNTIKLMSVPGMLEDMNTKQLFLDILDEIDTIAVTAKQEKEDKFIATVACKAAVKANMKLNAEEVDSLMQKLLDLPNPFTCPHGRPTAIKMTKYDLDKKFNRR